ncbi:MAG TPA: metal ABC transporter substrate-binding protein [Actinomycetes bacterium]|nr:metal ABC transporter substrate-binding protein [Actinomycetes bacterium]
MPLFARTSHALIPIVLVGAVGLAASGCSDAADSGGELKVATTVAPITSIAANIGGDRVDIEGIVPEGTNSHTFEPAPQVAELLSTADVVFINGLDLEDPTKALAEANMKDDATLVEIGNEVLPEEDYIYDFSFPEEDGKPNPHLWTDPTYAAQYAEVIAEKLSEKDPDNADYYEKNLDQFTDRANALADALRSDQATVPDGNLKLLTYHDAYAYFAKTFGWEVIGAVQPKNFEDPTPDEVARIIDQVEAENVPTIFGSEVFPSSVLEEIGNATGARYEDTLRDDDLPGEPGDPEHSWLGLMRYDYVTMIEGLGGKATELLEVDVSDVAPDEAEYPQ